MTANTANDTLADKTLKYWIVASQWNGHSIAGAKPLTTEKALNSLMAISEHTGPGKLLKQRTTLLVNDIVVMGQKASTKMSAQKK